jgi:3-hydroxybutyryl-CoA dehydrogenase
VTTDWRPARTAVVGGGTMGAGIAHVLLVAGTEVTVVEADEPARDRVLDAITSGMRKAADRGHVADPDEQLGRLRCTVDYADLAGSELVVEAVPEDATLKTRVLAAVEDAVADDALIGSNTSAMSISGLAAPLRHPERFLGLHFFNPVPASVLVEVVRGARTDPAAVERARAAASLLAKEAVVVNDSPGFATSRLGVALGLEAIRMVEDGVGSPEDIDRAMTLGYKHPVGPLRLGDLVGHDVRLAIAEYLQRELGERYAPPALLREMVAQGLLGRKTGKGFYEWR